MIKGARDKATRGLWHRRCARHLSANVAQKAYDKLVQLDAAESLEDLRAPPGNRLEKLSGDRTGQYSIRVNRQYRICFSWEDGDAYEVELTDYH